MLFRQKELLRWLGVSVFEIWVWLVCLTVFSVLLVLKVKTEDDVPCLHYCEDLFSRLKNIRCFTTLPGS